MKAESKSALTEETNSNIFDYKGERGIHRTISVFNFDLYLYLFLFIFLFLFFYLYF